MSCLVRRLVTALAPVMACLAASLPDAVLADTTFVAIGRYESLTSAQSKVTSVVGETVLMIGRIDSTQPYLRVVTVDPANGAAKGSAFQSTLPVGSCYPSDPVETMYSRHFLPGYALVIGAGLEIATLPIAVQSTGTPVAGSWGCLAVPSGSASAGHPRAVTEIPGSGFADGRARLFIGTDSGFVLVYSRSSQGSVTLDGQYNLGGGSPISDLGDVPQLSGVLLGVASGSRLSGYRVGSGAPQMLFTLTHPTGLKIKSFRTFEPGDRSLTSSSSEVHVAFCDGKTNRVYYTTLPATLLGSLPLDVYLVPPAFDLPTGGGLLPFTGSLLLMVGPGGDVRYRPGYLSGASAVGCVVNVSDATWQPCTPCPIVITGDVENSGSVSAADVIRLVGYVFKAGAAPQPCRASGDVNCTGAINATDVILLINFVFKSGTPPCNVCTQFNGTWSCP